MSQQNVKTNTVGSRNTDKTSDTDRDGNASDLFSALPLADDTQADQDGNLLGSFLALPLADDTQADQDGNLLGSFLALPLADAMQADQTGDLFSALPLANGMKAGQASSGGPSSPNLAATNGLTSTQTLYLDESGEPGFVSPLDINQAGLGDCWLASAIGELAMMSPNAIYNMITNNNNGTYTVTLSTGAGGFTSVTVGNEFNTTNPDDQLQPSTVGNVSEIWPLVIEEAVASLEGGYYALVGGWPSNAMETLTGNLTNENDMPAIGSTSVAWIQPYIAAGDMIEFCTPSTATTGDAYYNVVGDHCYMFAGLTTVNGVTMVETLNPWGINSGAEPSLIPISEISSVFDFVTPDSVTLGDAVDLRPTLTSITTTVALGVATFHLNWSAPVSVESGAAVSLSLSNGGTATYLSGSGTTNLGFTYTLPAGKSVSSLTVTGINEPGQYGPNLYDLYETATDQLASTYLGATTQTATAVAPTNLVDSNAAANSVGQGALAGSLVGITAHATSPDGNLVTYSLLINYGAFAINPTTGVVTVANSSASAFSIGTDTITVVATNDNLSTTANFNINITPSKAPTNMQVVNSGLVVLQDAPAGTFTGVTASAISPDGDAISFALLSNYFGAFSINATTGAVTVANTSALTVGTDTIAIAAYNDGLYALQYVGVNITGAYAPYGLNVLNNNSDNLIVPTAGAAVGAASGLVAYASSPDGNTVTYSLTNSDNGAFAINSSTGAITVASTSALESSVDALEAAALQSQADTSSSPPVPVPVYVPITVAAWNDGLSTSANFSIKVSAPVAPTNLVNTTGATTVMVGANVGGLTYTGLTVGATSPDGDGSTMTYSLTNSDGGAFGIVNGLVTVTNPSALTAGTDTITVAANNDGLTTSKNFAIDVIGNTGEYIFNADSGNDWMTGGSGYDVYFLGSTFGQDVINNNVGSSASASPNGEIDFSGASHEQLWFEQSGSNLVIDQLGTNHSVTVDNWFGLSLGPLGTFPLPGAQVQSFDSDDGDTLANAQVAQLVQAMATYSAANTGFNPTTATAMPTNTTLQNAIAIAWGLAHAPTTLVNTTPDPYAPNIPNVRTAGAAVGTTVAVTANAASPDGHTVTYSLLNNDNGAFAINPNTGVVTVANTAALTSIADESTGGSPVETSITVAAWNDGLDIAGNFQIWIAPPVAPTSLVDSNSAPNLVGVGAAVGTPVGITASATESDGDPITYSISGTSFFAINASTGVVTASNPGGMTALGPTTYSAIVTATADGRSTSANFNIVSEAVAPTNLVDSNSAPNVVGIDPAVGTAVGITASATESDGDPITYTLSGSSFFAINPTTGVVTATNPGGMMALGPTTYSVMVTAFADGISTSADFSINTTPPVTPTTPVNATGATTVMVSANIEAGAAVGITASATESDGDPITYGIAGTDIFAINAGTGVVTASIPSAFNASQTQNYPIGVEATADGITTAANFNVDVIAGSSASTSFFSDTGNDSMTGGSVTNLYYFLANFGQDVVNNSYSGTTPSGEINFYSGPTHEQLWLQQSGGNLIIDVLGTKSSVTVQNWFGYLDGLGDTVSEPGAQVASIDTTDGYGLANAQVAQLVQAMATYSSAHTGFNPATAAAMPTDTTLQAAIAAAWTA